MKNKELAKEYRYDVVKDLVSHSKQLDIKHFEVRSTLTPDNRGMETEFRIVFTTFLHRPHKRLSLASIIRLISEPRICAKEVT